MATGSIMDPQTAADKAVEVIGSACKTSPNGSKLIKLEERSTEDLVLSGRGVVHGFSVSIKCDKGERSDVLSFNQKIKTGSRWKGKGAERKALSDPISTIIAQLQSSLRQSNSQGILTGSGVLLDVDSHQTDLLGWACFGRPYATADKDKQWFQLNTEETFFFYYVLKCIRVVDMAEKDSEKNADHLLMHMSSNRKNFVNLFKAYSHLRLKNWVVRAGSQYGVDFVAYRHHPSLVHSEYAVLVLSEDDGEANGRFRVWSDVQSTLRLCGSVAKTLLVLNIQKHGKKSESLSNLDSYTVEERTFTRWTPEQAKEEGS